METVTLPAERREHLGTKYARRLREHGKIPAVIYGHKQDPESIALDAHQLESELHHHARVLSVKLEGKDEQFLIKAVQYDHLGSTPIHLDLMRVNLDERVKLSVEVTLRGIAAGTHEGAMVLQPVTELEVECLVTAIPDELRLVITDLAVGETLTAGDVALPDGVTLITEPEDVVVTCRLPAAAASQEAEEDEATEEESSAEPEVITRGKAEDEAEG